MEQQTIEAIQKIHKNIVINYELVKLASTTNNGKKIGVVNMKGK